MLLCVSRGEFVLQRDDGDPAIPVPQVGVILQLRPGLEQLPRPFIRLSPVLAEDASLNLPLLQHGLQARLHREANVPTHAARSISVDELQQTQVLLASDNDLALQSLQSLLDRRAVRFQIYAFDFGCPSQAATAVPG